MSDVSINFSITPINVVFSFASAGTSVAGVASLTAGTGLQGNQTTGNVTLNLRPATASVIGGVRPGTGLSVDASGVLSATSTAGVSSVSATAPTGFTVTVSTPSTTPAIALAYDSANKIPVNQLGSGTLSATTFLNGLGQFVTPSTSTPGVTSVTSPNGTITASITNQVLSLDEAGQGAVVGQYKRWDGTKWAPANLPASVSSVTGGTGITVSGTASVPIVSANLATTSAVGVVKPSSTNFAVDSSGTMTLINNVSRIIAGTGITVSPSGGTGDVTITSSTSGVGSVVGTSGQINATTSSGTVTLSLPNTLLLTGKTMTIDSVSDSKGNVRDIPVNNQSTSYTLVALDAGRLVSISSGGITVPSGIFSAGNAVSIFNNSSVPLTITQGSGVTLYQAGTSSTGNRTLSTRGFVTLMCIASNVFVLIGAGLT